jgi:arylsulfatase A-like enzyme
MLQTGAAFLDARQTRAAADRPNILLLMADQHRGDCLGVEGNRAAHTPNLDRLAKDGAHFQCAYSSTPTCTPARSALLTGLSPWSHGMMGYGRVADRHRFELPRMLGEAGYHTMAIGKLHYSPQRNLHGFHQALLDESGRVQSIDFRSDYRSWFWSQAPGLDPDATGISFNDYRSKAYVLPEELHPTHWTGETAVRFLRDYNRAQPFFLKVSFARPHSPYDPPPRLMRRFEDADLPAASVGSWAGRYAPRSDGGNDIWHGDVGAAQVRRSRAGYYGSVAFVDEQIGHVLETLDARGLLERTLILYLSDHGDMTGDHHLWRKGYPYEASARIPMIVRWPKGLISGTCGERLKQPVEIRDVLPTFLEAAGATIPETIEGCSLLPLAAGKPQGWRDYIDLEHDVCYGPQNHWNALTDGRWKYIYHALEGEEQLFDLASDPGERNDLAGNTNHATTLRQWRSRMIEALAPRGEQFVRGGNLVPRPASMLYSPNYPGVAPKKSSGA